MYFPFHFIFQLPHTSQVSGSTWLLVAARVFTQSPYGQPVVQESRVTLARLHSESTTNDLGFLSKILLACPLSTQFLFKGMYKLLDCSSGEMSACSSYLTRRELQLAHTFENSPERGQIKPIVSPVGRGLYMPCK